MKQLFLYPVLTACVCLNIFAGCVAVPVAVPGSQKPVLYSDAPMPTTGKFREVRNFWYWGPFRLNNRKENVSDIVTAEFASHPEAHGIKNLIVKVYTSFWWGGAGQGILTPVGGFIISTCSGLGFVMKSVDVSGEFF